MHWKLIDGTLKGAPVWGPLSMVQSVVINFSSKVYSKSLPKGLDEAKPIDLYFDER